MPQFVFFLYLLLLFAAPSAPSCGYRAAGIDLAHLEYAKDKIMMGPERKAIYSADNRRKTAYHETGHALVGLFTQGATPLHKATILPRGSALGITFFLPAEDQHSLSLHELNAKMDVALGGRAAEEIVLGADKVCTGASSDF